MTGKEMPIMQISFPDTIPDPRESRLMTRLIERQVRALSPFPQRPDIIRLRGLLIAALLVIEDDGTDELDEYIDDVVALVEHLETVRVAEGRGRFAEYDPMSPE
jgi:hypothetical protein